MKRILFAFIVFNALVIQACNNTSPGSKKETSPGNDTTRVSQVKYTCTMHPEVISDTAGHCPKCGMDLVPIKDSTRK